MGHLDKQEKQDIARAIVSCKGRVSAAEVVSLTGLPLLTVNRCLNAMAYDCGAHLQVNSDGTLSYLFPQNFDFLYRVGSIQRISKFLLVSLERGILFAIRLAVGTILFASVAFVYALTFCVLEIVAVFTNMAGGALSPTHRPDKSRSIPAPAPQPPAIPNPAQFSSP